jgi:prepilin-type N-terminal cleavage/methylation domain-containing protein
VDERGGGHERGFTLIEIVIAVAIVAATVAAGVGVSLASRSFAVAAAATEFDQLLDSARTIAREVQGATLAFVPDAYGDGTEVRLLAGSGSAGLTPTTLPALHTRATIEELEALRTPPFAFVVHVSGALGGRPGFHVGDATTGAEVGCPASGAFHFVIHVAGGSADRFVPCRVTLAAIGPVTLSTWPPAPPAASPTPCGGPCAPATLPPVPLSSPSCPPNYIVTSGGCAPAPTPNPGPRYHVTISLASPTMTVGGTDSLTAQATLVNPGGAPAGTPPSIPVAIQQSTDATCTAAPAGSQPSGSTFTLTGISSGTCTVVIQGDTSAVPGATSDSTPVNATVSGAPSATPSPKPCDLVTNGKCYVRIVDANQRFWKYVEPDVVCDSQSIGFVCSFVDAIHVIQLGPSYAVQPTVAPSDSEHELLFKINRTAGILEQCSSYDIIRNLPGGSQFFFPGDGTGAPVNAPVGFGEPSVYFTINHVFPNATAARDFQEPTDWTLNTTLLDLFEATAQHKIGDAYSFTFSSAMAVASGEIEWSPDFPGCDASGPLGRQYGKVEVELLFEIYQAVPLDMTSHKIK